MEGEPLEGEGVRAGAQRISCEQLLEGLLHHLRQLVADGDVARPGIRSGTAAAAAIAGVVGGGGGWRSGAVSEQPWGGG